MTFLTNFSSQSKDFLDSTNDLMTKTNEMKVKIKQLVEFCQAISWNKNTLKDFQLEIKKLYDNCT